MSRTAVVYPTQEELQAKSVGELNLYIRRIHAQLEYLNTGPVHKALVKQLEMAERVREMRRSQDRGEVT
jgi:hypothetical protein